MKFNAKKCNILLVYCLGNKILQKVSDAKYLGIQIDDKFDLNKHISTVAARGQSKLVFINRTLKAVQRSRETQLIFHSLGLHYNIAAVIIPTQKSNKDKIEKVQRRAAQFV